jgi:hypothetical protein
MRTNLPGPAEGALRAYGPAQGLGFRQGLTYISGMLPMRKKPPAPSRRWRRQIPLWAHDEAQHYLARARQYSLDEEECAQLIQVVLGHVGRCDEAKARAGLE